MFDIAPTELLIIAIVALVVIGPKDLPRVMRTVGNWIGRAKGMARHFRSGIDTMIRESELAELEAKWKAENERIMQAHSAQVAAEAKTLPAPDEAGGAAQEPVVEPAATTAAPPPTKPGPEQS